MLTIGEFSKLTGVSARMLRHYDILGLLRPAAVGETSGYRYYDPAQVDLLRRIETLSRYGFRLAEVRELLRLDEPELARRIHARRIRAHSELIALRKALRLMEEQIMNMEENPMPNDNYGIIVMENPAQRVFGIRRTISVAEIHDLFTELKTEAAKRGLRQAGPTQQLFLGETFDCAAMDIEAQMVVSGDHPDVREMPASTCVATTHTGPYASLKYAYDAIAAWMADHPEYEVSGPAIERFLRDEGMVTSPEELETGILFPVRTIR